MHVTTRNGGKTRKRKEKWNVAEKNIAQRPKLTNSGTPNTGLKSDLDL